MDWLRLLYESIGVPFPRASIAMVAVIGALLFGGGWWLLGRQYMNEHPLFKTTINLDNHSVSRVGDRLQSNQRLHETNASSPVVIDAQPLVIEWGVPEHRRIAIYKNEKSHLPEQDYAPGQQLPQLKPGRYYIKITRPNDEYTPLNIEVVSHP